MNILIESINYDDLVEDRRWVPDGENQWFLPYYLDLKNQSYSGYWYATEHCIEEEHFHTGVSYGVILQGSALIVSNGKEHLIEKNKNFFMPPNILHSGKLIPNEKYFLCFGTIVGTTHYEHETLDVETYYEAVKSHYSKYNLPLDHLFSKKQELIDA